jgi:N,N-dimethylformamidase
MARSEHTKMRLMGYLSELSADPGQQIEAKISANKGEYTAEIVRLDGVQVAGDHRVGQVAVPNPAGGKYPGRLQELRSGSFAFAAADGEICFSTFGFDVWLQPTLHDRDRQVIIAVKADRDQACWSLSLTRDAFELCLGKGRASATIRLLIGPVTNRWVRVAGGRGERNAQFCCFVDGRWPAERHFASSESSPLPLAVESRLESVSIGAQADSTDTGQFHFNGRIESPGLSTQPVERGHDSPFGAEGRLLKGEVVAAWDFSLNISARTITDTSANAMHGVLVNRPARGVCGHAWSGRFLRYKENPAEWGAIHFHEDDLNDAGWETDFSFAMPSDTPSGIYAVKLHQNDRTDYLPFYVRATSTRNRVLFIAPTNTYLAYANDHLGQGEMGLAHEKRMREKIVLNETDEYIFANRELGLSIYDTHADGVGIMYSSWNRPVLNFRPDHITWLNAGRRHFAADFYITGWLEKQGIPFDVVTDEDVHHGGEELLRKYTVVVSGSHPEYPTPQQLDAIEAFVARGGRFMYLGGNGWFWVTSYDRGDSRTLECRRGYAAERSWTSHPGEIDHSSTGEVGGLYRHRGRSSRLLFGVTAAGIGWGTASGYKRTPDSFAADVAHLFKGIEEDAIGDFGYVLGGASGDEIDSADFNSGTPTNARILMSSRHNEMYLPFLDTAMQVQRDANGLNNPEVRSDVVYIDTGGGGKIFSVGSICWAGALAFNSYSNNISRLTKNVLDDFLS